MKIKTSELTGIALDRAVAKCKPHGSGAYWTSPEFLGTFRPSTDWAQGGPIIERELLSPEPLLDTNCALIKWVCRNWKGDGVDYAGPTLLIAAMRCYVASKLGDEVDVPEELV